VRPLDRLGSIKLKLGVLIVVAVAVTGLLVPLGERVGLPPVLTGIVAAAVALAFVQVLAHGMTYPLREMVAAARAMARGDYDRRVTATSRDEVGELARAFNSMATELAEVDRMRRDFVANASHELRTPLGALRATLENLVDGVEQPEPEVLADLLAQANRLAELVAQLLDLSRLESGTASLARGQVDASDLLERVAQDWEPAAAARGIVLERIVQPSRLALDVDARRMHQVLDNLVANAVRHAPDGSPVTMRVLGGDDRVEIEVEDQGPGIADEDAERVFERFYRADRSRSADEGGTGLGLSIARWIVELHDGEIRVDPGGAAGCRLIVTLPR
jgi:signal transduction histidine kinase